MSKAPSTPGKAEGAASGSGTPGSTPGRFLASAAVGPTDEDREQALRDYKVTIEYKHLKAHAPGGVYVVPSLTDLRQFHGVVFVRRGLYTNGIFKFRMTLSPAYNAPGEPPRITFVSPVYNPHVNPDTLELSVAAAYPSWDPEKHFLVTALTFLKKIFYTKTFLDAEADPAARDLATSDPVAYRRKVEECVHDSQRDVFLNPDGATVRFTEDELAHNVLRDLLHTNVKDPQAVSKSAILAMIDKASRV